MSNIEGKVVVITGASSGLGLTAAKELAKRGAKVVVGARRLDRLTALVKELGQPAETAVAVDVTKREDLQTLVKTALDVYGKIDVFVNNAGIAAAGPLEEGDTDKWDSVIDVNIKGVLYGISAVLPVFKEQKSGQIINVSSTFGHQVYPGMTVYSASKFAVRAISEGLRQEVKPYNVRVLNVSPGMTESDIVSTMPAHIQEQSKNFKAAPSTAFSDALIYAIGQPENTSVNEILFNPTGN